MSATYSETAQGKWCVHVWICVGIHGHVHVGEGGQAESELTIGESGCTVLCIILAVVSASLKSYPDPR